MKDIWHILVTVMAGTAIATTPGAQAIIGAHPVASTVSGVAWAILGSILPSPLNWILAKRG
jgi:hypothetical protein